MKISIITVVLNCEETVADCLRSIESQDYDDIEHLVIDGGSADSTLKILRQRELVWRKVVSEPDNGIYDAMNKGISLATGDVIGFLNADDVYPSKGVLRQVSEAFKTLDIDACYGDLCYVGSSNPEQIVRYWRAGEFISGSFARGWVPPHPTLFVRRSLYERLGNFNLRLTIAADVELMFRFFELHLIRVAYIPEVLVHMRQGGVSNRNWRNVIVQNLEIIKAYSRSGVRFNSFKFILGKVWRRVGQFVWRPPGIEKC